jgi:hypothetical protein
MNQSLHSLPTWLRVAAARDAGFGVLRQRAGHICCKLFVSGRMIVRNSFR